ncbi:MAG: hypothetical protein AAF985_01650, partial [Bacteroidota bacterium]
MICTISRQLKSSIKHLTANIFLLFLLAMLCPAVVAAQDCTCTNCPGTIPAGPTTVDFDFEIDGALINDLSSPFQGVCGIAIEFRHSFIWKVEMTLTSPGGQSVNLIGPNIDPPLGSFTGFAFWDILFLPCGDAVDPDTGFLPTWDNDQTWQTGGQYSGSYYPFAGCLGDFNTGAVNGTWTLSVTNSHGLYTGLVRDFRVIFCNELGLNCFNCDADAGDWSSLPNERFCQGDSLLNLTLTPQYNPSPPDPTLYDYRYLIAQSDVLVAIDSVPDLREFAGGTYQICGLSYLVEDSLSLPSINGVNTITELRTDLTSVTPNFCGQVSNDCIEVEIYPTRSTIRDTICAGETFFFGNIMADTTGVYYDTLTSSFAACTDSIVSLELEVIDTALIQINEILCEGQIYQYRGVNYSSTGVYLQQFPIPNSDCDTTVRLDLVFNPAVVSDIRDTICEGDFYQIGSDIFTMSGDYQIILPSTVDCDTTIFLNLTVIDSIITTLEETICAGEQYSVGSQVFHTSGTYEILLPSFYSDCDSLVRLDLTVRDSLLTNLTDTICFGESVTIGTQQFGTTGIYDLRLDAFAQCDSFIQLNLTVIDPINTPLMETICSGDTLFVGDTILTTSGMYELVLESFQGCDSTVRVDLMVAPSIQTNVQRTICQGDVVAIGDSIYNNTGLFFTPLLSSNQCDSIVALDLVVLNPTAQITFPDTLDCDQSTLVLQGNAPTSVANVSYQWTHLDNVGTGIVIGANTPNPLIDRGGQYELIITETYQNVSCTTTAIVEVLEDFDAPTLGVGGGTLTCTNPQVELSSSSSTAGLMYQWNGPNAFVSNLPNPLVTTPGNYQLTVTGDNGCTNSAIAIVLDDLVDPDLIVQGDTINCTYPSAQLNAITTTVGVNYSWMGPNGFTSVLANPVVAVDGNYQVTITAPNGCTTTGSTQVREELVPPDFFIAFDSIDCNQSAILIEVNSNVIDLTYQWEGPAGFISNLPNPMVNLPGDYFLTVTASNTCTVDTMITVIANLIPPDLQLTVTDTLDCLTPTVDITTISTASTLLYSWTGPNGFTSNLANPVASAGGIYEVTVTSSNGCTNESSIQVETDISVPTIQLSEDTLSCNQQMLSLSSIVIPVPQSVAWTGPNGFTSNQLSPQIDRPGIYNLEVTANNGCTTMASTTIELDTLRPDFDLLGASLNCQQTTAQLQVLPLSEVEGYLWMGPNGFASTEQNPVVALAGLYQVSAIAPNGCERIRSIEVMKDTIAPGVALLSDTIDCASSFFLLSASSNMANVTYQWEGPMGFSSNLNNPEVSEPGLYTLTVTAPNFCTTIIDTMVIADLTLPDLMTQTDTINCENPIGVLQAFSTTSGVNYLWSGPNGFSSTETNPQVSEAGTYQVTVTGANACTTSATLDVIAETDLPDITLTGGELTCDTTQIQLQSQSSLNDLTYSWSGPNGFSSAMAAPIVNLSGIYSLTVTAINGCQAVAETEVLENTSIPMVQLLEDTLTCFKNTLLLQSNPSEFDLHYQWSGPNGFVSLDSMPEISQAGTYGLTLTASNGCQTIEQVTILDDTTAPDISVLGDTLNCARDSVQLQSQTSEVNLQYTWTGPSGFNASVADPFVDIAGAYQLTVTASNGCTAITDTEVFSDFEVPDLMVLAMDSLDCVTPSVELVLQSSVQNLQYNWEGPGGYGSTTANPMVSMAGAYSVTITAGNACTNTAVVNVFQDGALPDLEILGENLDCTVSSVNLQAQSSVTDLTYNWTGPMAFSSNLANPQIDQAGIYSLTVTAANGCQAIDQITILQDTQQPLINLITDTLTCLDHTIGLEVSSNLDLIAYNWMGPNGFTFSDSMPSISEPGLYNVTVTAANGCTRSTNAVIIAELTGPDLNLPADTLDCNDPDLILQALSSVANLDYQWEGPLAFSSTLANPIVTNPGTYQLTVTDATGCTSSDTVNIMADFSVPDILILNNDSLDCQTPQVQLISQTTASDLTFSWTGPGAFTTDEVNPIVAEAGLYQLIVTATNGCTNTDVVTVTQDGAIPDIAITGGVLTCGADTITLMSQSSISNLSYSWSGPNGFVSTDPNPEIDEAGDYQLIITASNGCQAVEQVTVTADLSFPDVLLSADTLNCLTDSITIQSVVTGAGLNYSWTGPNGFATSDTMPRVGQAGWYFLSVVGSNACANTDSIEVIADSSLPMLTVSVSDSLDCSNSAVQLQSQTDASGATYSWTGPNAFASAQANPIVNTAGEYQLTITATNGCIAMATAEVLANSDLPNLQIELPDTLNCSNTQVQLISQSNVSALLYSWSGPNGFVSSLADPIVNTAGNYQVTITASNGCTNEGQVTVVQDEALPDLDIIGGTLTCLVDTLTLQSQSSFSGLTYAWSGPNGFVSTLADPEVDAPGDYGLTVTAVNGCQTSAQTAVGQNDTSPDLQLLPDTLDCANTVLILSVNSSVNNLSYLWSGPANFCSIAAMPQINVAGTYAVTITATNGCSNQSTTEITENTTVPDLLVLTDTLTCNDANGQIQAMSLTSNLQYQWSGPNGFSANEMSPTVNLGGQYLVTITAPNACTNTGQVDVLQDDQIPDISIASPDTLNCGMGSIQLVSDSQTPDLSYNWMGPNGFSSTEANPLVMMGGIYELEVTASNGCINTTVVIVEEDGAIPDLMIIGDTLDCNQTMASLEGQSSDVDLSYIWSGPNNFVSDQSQIQVNALGEYGLTITAANGCTQSSTFELLNDTIAPIVQAFGDTLNCEQSEIQLSSIVIPGIGTYQWTGPNGFNSSLTSPLVANPGTYTLSFTGPNGCVGMNTTEVIANLAVPSIQLSADTLTCTNESVDLVLQSDVQNLNYNWSGPNGFNSLEVLPSVTTAGTYYVTITANNSCSSTDSIHVFENAQTPSLVLSTEDLTCNQIMVIIQAQTNETGLNYSWSGPGGFSSIEQNPEVSQAGFYELTLTAPNGCSIMDGIFVAQDADAPTVEIAGDTLDCLNGTTQLLINDPQADWTFSWIGPNGFSTDQANPTVTLL